MSSARGRLGNRVRSGRLRSVHAQDDSVVQVALGVLIFVASFAIDYAHARYLGAVAAGKSVRAANWSLAQWLAATIGFVVAVKVSLWVLPFEAAGMYAGTLAAIKSARGLH